MSSPIFFAPESQPAALFVTGLLYGFLIMLSGFCHGLGHLISSRMIQAPVAYVLVTATVNVTHYEDDVEPSSRVHIRRSIGGPVANLVLGADAIVVSLTLSPNNYLVFFGAVSILMGLMTLLHIPSLDGAVIWHELRRRQK